MDLLRDWRRRVFGAAAGAVVAPVAIVLAAVVVGVGGGGLRGIGAVSQVVRGPEPPRITPSTAAGNRDAAEEAGRLLARVQRNAQRAARRNAAAEGQASPPAGRRRGGGRPQSTRPNRPGGGSKPGPAPTGPSGTPAPPSSTPQPPAPEPSTVRQVGEQVHQVTDPVPVAGEPAGQVVDLIVETVESLPVPLPR